MVACAEETQDYNQGGIQQYQTADTRMVHVDLPIEDSASVSAGKITSQIQKEKRIYQKMGNILLKRREPVISKLPKHISDHDKLDLHASSVSSCALFDESVVKQLQSITRADQLRMVQSNRSQQNNKLQPRAKLEPSFYQCP